MKRLIILAPLALLVACDSGPDVDMTNASVSEVAEEMRKEGGDKFVNPGKWKQVVTLVSIDAPGMPPEARTMMQKAMDKVQEHEVCLTEAQAKSPKADFFTGADQNCSYEHFKWGDGKIDMKLVCKHPNATQTMALTGNYQPNSYNMAMATTNVGRSPQERMTMKMKVDAKRIGACDATTRAQG